MQSPSCCRVLAGLLGKLSLCSSTDGAPNWENLVYLTRLSHLSVDSAADVGVMLQVNFMPNLQTLNLTNYSLQANTVTNFLHLQHLMLTCGFDEVLTWRAAHSSSGWRCGLLQKASDSSFCRLGVLYSCSICLFTAVFETKLTSHWCTWLLLNA